MLSRNEDFNKQTPRHSNCAPFLLGWFHAANWRGVLLFTTMHIRVTQNKDFYLDGHGYGYPSYNFELDKYKISSVPILKGRKVYYMAILINEDFSVEETRTVELTTVPDHAAGVAAFEILISRLEISLDCYITEFILES